MRKLALITGIFCTTALPGLAADDPMAAYYGNTLVSRDGGITSITNFKPDHTFTGRVPSFGFTYQGTWTLEGNTVCRTYNPPLPTQDNPDCGPLRVHKLGEKETDENGDSQEIDQGIK